MALSAAEKKQMAMQRLLILGGMQDATLEEKAQFDSAVIKARQLLVDYPGGQGFVAMTLVMLEDQLNGT